MWLLRISITSFTQLTAIGLCVNVCRCEWVSESVCCLKKKTPVHLKGEHTEQDISSLLNNK